jgi:aspartyl-tRNA(Asn)/glutamyl-tRNA(Gln) amidotransferase subunit A
LTLQELNKENKRLNAFITILDEPRGWGEGPLSGLTYAAKDNFLTKGVQTTAGSKILEDWIPPYESEVTSRIEAAGARLVGKTNLDEFAMGSSTENSAYGVVKNPHDEARVPGGSSGGSAAAVAAGLVDFAIGTDTGGSIRQPAAFCGVIGFKPTYGRVSRYGIIPLGSSLDQAGVFAGDVGTVAKVMNVIAGKDEKDATSADREVPDFQSSATQGVRGIKIGFIGGIAETDAGTLQAEINQKLIDARNVLVEAGVERGNMGVKIPHLNLSAAVYYIVLPAEASSNLARYDGIHFAASDRGKTLLERYVETRSAGFGVEPKRRISIGTFVLSSGYQEAYYQKAQAVRALIARDFDEAFKEVEVIITPTTPTTAFKIGEKQTPLEMYLNDIYTIPANLAGLPAISIPAGKDSSGLPIGLQIIGPRWGDEAVLRVAAVLEEQLS